MSRCNNSVLHNNLYYNLFYVKVCQSGKLVNAPKNVFCHRKKLESQYDTNTFEEMFLTKIKYKNTKGQKL